MFDKKDMKIIHTKAVEKILENPDGRFGSFILISVVLFLFSGTKLVYKL